MSGRFILGMMGLRMLGRSRGGWWGAEEGLWGVL